MFIYNWSKRLIETLQRIDAKCTEATELHGRYCISDAKIRDRIRAGRSNLVRKDHALKRDGMVGAQGLEPWTR